MGFGSKLVLIHWLMLLISLGGQVRRTGPAAPDTQHSGHFCQEPAWGTLPMAKVMRKEASAYAKAGSSLRKPPLPEHLPPKPESVLCSHLHLWLNGGLSPITISLGEGVNLQLQLIKIPGYDKSVSTYKLLWRSSSLPDQVRPATCDCLQPPNREWHEML